MASFSSAWPIILRHEGGYADHPADKGGPTNFGVTAKTLGEFLKQSSPATATEVQNLSVLTAQAIYKTRYWAAIRADDIMSQAVANYFMDMAVLMGPAQASKLMQGVCGVKQDGIIGPVSIAVINSHANDELLAGFYMACVNFLVRLVSIDPTQVVFLANWMKRCQEILQTALAL